jgi:hypothetical protein
MLVGLGLIGGGVLLIELEQRTSYFMGVRDAAWFGLSSQTGVLPRAPLRAPYFQLGRLNRPPESDHGLGHIEGST